MSDDTPVILLGPRHQTGVHYHIKAVFFDVDNTLVGNESMELPSSSFVDTAIAVKDRLHVGIASARQLMKVKHILDTIQSDGLSILCNGAQIYDGRTGRVVQEWVIPAAACAYLLKRLSKTTIRHWVNDDGTDHEPAQEPAYMPVKPFVIVLKQISLDEVAEVESWLRDYGDETIAGFIAHQTDHGSGWRYDFFITHRYANKRTALQLAAELMQLPVGQLAAVGDGRNDAVMVGGVGVGVAMGNAAQETLDAATFIAPAQVDDGAATALRFLSTLCD